MAEDALLRELYAGIEVLKSQQTEINRRLGLIENSLEEGEDEADEARNGWWTWSIQIIGQVLIVSVLVGIGKAIGVDLQW